MDDLNILSQLSDEYNALAEIQSLQVSIFVSYEH